MNLGDSPAIIDQQFTFRKLQLLKILDNGLQPVLRNGNVWDIALDEVDEGEFGHGIYSFMFIVKNFVLYSRRVPIISNTKISAENLTLSLLNLKNVTF